MCIWRDNDYSYIRLIEMAAGNTSEVRNPEREILKPSKALLKPSMLNKATQCLTLYLNYN